MRRARTGSRSAIPQWRVDDPDAPCRWRDRGLNEFVAEDGTPLHPRVAPVFFSFRIMVGTGMAMLLVSWGTLVLMRRRHAGIDGLPKPVLYALVAMTFSGWLATLAGWYTTEIGRQPWLVQGVLSTKQAVADVPAPMVLSTLLIYLTVYAALTFIYIGVLVYLARKAAKGEGVADRPTGGDAQVALLQPAGMTHGTLWRSGGLAAVHLCRADGAVDPDLRGAGRVRPGRRRADPVRRSGGTATG